MIQAMPSCRGQSPFRVSQQQWLGAFGRMRGTPSKPNQATRAAVGSRNRYWQPSADCYRPDKQHRPTYWQSQMRHPLLLQQRCQATPRITKTPISDTVMAPNPARRRIPIVNLTTRPIQSARKKRRHRRQCAFSILTTADPPEILHRPRLPKVPENYRGLLVPAGNGLCINESMPYPT